MEYNRADMEIVCKLGEGGVLKETVVTNMKRETDPSKLNKALVDR